MAKRINLDKYDKASQGIFANCLEILGGHDKVDVTFVGTINKKELEVDCIMWKTIDIVSEVIMISTKQKETFKMIKLKIGTVIHQHFNENYARIENVSKVASSIPERGVHPLFGTEMVYFILLLLHKMGCERAVLHDVATVMCNNVPLRLSLLHMLIKGTGWYENFGFHIASDAVKMARMASHTAHGDPAHIGIDGAIKAFYGELAKIRAYPLATFVNDVEKMRTALVEVYMKHEINSIEFLDRTMYLTDRVVDIDAPDYPANASWIFYKLLEHMNELHDVLSDGANTKGITFGEYIAKTHDSDCTIYVDIVRHLLNNELFSWNAAHSDNPYAFRYKNVTYALPIITHFIHMKNVAPYYVYDFPRSVLRITSNKKSSSREKRT